MGLRTVDLFCGCGGFTQGLVDVGFDVVCGIDINETILETYARNFDHAALCRDLSDWEGCVDALRERFPGGVECVAGSPPCVEFSRAGNQVEGGIASLTISFARIVTSLRPPLFLMENVPDVVMSSSFEEARGVLCAAGYDLCTIVKDAKYCGVPQSRRRVFVVGCLDGGAAPLEAMVRESARNEPKVTIREYLGARGVECPDYFYFPARNKFQSSVISADDQYPTLRSCNGICMNPRPANTASYVRRPNDAAPIDQAATLTVAQAAGISSFPVGYKWPSDRRQVGIMLGNCVPPGVASYIGVTVLQHLGATVLQHLGGSKLPPPPDREGVWVNPRQKRPLKMTSHIRAFEEKSAELDAASSSKVRKSVIVPSDVHAGDRRDDAFRPSTAGEPMELFYTMGSDSELDCVAREVMGFDMKPGWTFHIKERICQRSRIDDMFVIVPGQPVPFRGKAMLIKNGHLPPPPAL